MAINNEIVAGETLAVKIKEYFYYEQPWSAILAFKIGHDMTHIKRVIKPLYPDYDAIRIYHELNAFSKEDLKGILDTNVEKSRTKKIYVNEMVDYEISKQAS